MTLTTQKSLYTRLPGRYLRIDDSQVEIPVCTPEFRKSNGSYLKKRGLHLLNRFLQKGRFETVGSPWLPGFWVMNQSESLALARNEELRPNSLNLVITSEPVEGPNWHSFLGEPLMLLENNWTTFEEYAGGMKKKYRQRLRKAMALGETLEKRWLNTEDYKECAVLLEHTLMDKVVVLPEDLEELLQRFREMFGDAFRIQGFYRGGELMAFISTISDGSILRAMHYGAREDAPHHTYSFAMFSVIERGITQGYRTINLGRTATEIKSTYGAVPSSNYFSFYTRNVFFKSILRVAALRYTPKKFELRSPFKEGEV